MGKALQRAARPVPACDGPASQDQVDDTTAYESMRGAPVSKKSALQNLGGKYLPFHPGDFATPYHESTNLADK